MLYSAAEKSLFLKLLRRICRLYCFLEEKVFFWYKQSRARNSILNIAEGIKVSLRESFLGRLSRGKDRSAILDNSRVAQGLVAAVRYAKIRLLSYLSHSSAAGPAGRISREISFFPLKAYGIMVITAVAVETLLRIILAKETTFTGWAVRALLLSLGAAGLGSSAGWSEIKKTSIFLRLIGGNTDALNNPSLRGPATVHGGDEAI